MNALIEEIDGGITRVVLEGRMDIQGAQAVDLKMNVVAGSAERLLLDLSGVSFLSSMGLRSIVVPAKAISRRGGKMVLFAPTPTVEEVLNLANIGAIIPIHHELDAALAALR